MTNPKWVPRGSEVLLHEAAAALRVFGWLGCALGLLGMLLCFVALTSWSFFDALLLTIIAPLTGTVGHALLCGLSDVIKLLKKSAGIGFSGTISGANIPHIADSTQRGPYFLRGEGQKDAGRAPGKDTILPPQS